MTYTNSADQDQLVGGSALIFITQSILRKKCIKSQMQTKRKKENKYGIKCLKCFRTFMPAKLSSPQKYTLSHCCVFLFFFVGEPDW